MHQELDIELKRTKEYRCRLIRICEKQMNEVTRLQKLLPKKVDVSELYNPLLDIWKELK